MKRWLSPCPSWPARTQLRSPPRRHRRCRGATAAGEAPGPGSAAGEAIAAFETVRTVLQSPRCVNCHPTGDVPLQGDDGHLHEPPITRGPEAAALPASPARLPPAKQNLPASYARTVRPACPPSGGPAADHRLVFWGLNDSKALCEQIKDRSATAESRSPSSRTT